LLGILDPIRFAVSGDPVAYARLSGRSFWVMKFHDGTVIEEYRRDWTELPRKGRQKLRLVCPNGQVAELGTSHDNTGRFVQLKLAVASTSMGRHTLAHLIGYLYGLNGETSFACWDYRTDTLRTFVDNAYDCKWEHLGPLAVDHLGIAAP
jgi:hypothetical protein